MKNLKLGKVLGIEVRLHSTFPLFVLIIGVLLGGGDLGGTLRVMAVMSTLFAFVLLHELGHSLMARAFGVPVYSITLLPIGGLAATGPMPRRPSREILIALAGPAVNVVLAIVLAFLLALTDLPFSIEGTGLAYFLSYLLGANIMLAVFNLVPAFPMDGGRVFRAILATRLSYRNATRAAVLVGKIFAAAFFVLGLFKHEFLMLSFIGIFLFFSGRRELQAVEFEDHLRQRQTGDFVDPRPWFFGDRHTRVAEIGAIIGESEDLAYGVLDLEGLRYGVLTRRQLMSACLAMPPMLELRRLVENSSTALPAQLPLQQALPILRAAPHGLMPVRSGRDIVGVISLESLEPLVRDVAVGG